MISRFAAFAALALALASACHPEEPATRVAEVRTVENSELGSIPVEAPPVLEEQVPLPVPTPGAATSTQTPAQAKEEALARRMDLPFAPAIAMDPVDGAKVSITTVTPVTEYKDKIYYFSSAGNRQTFLANPETYLKGQLADY